MVDKNSAPSYSIGGAKKASLILDNGHPGPGAYETLSYIRHSNSQDKLPKEKRFSEYETPIPGPGSYTQYNKQHIPTALVKSRSKQKKIPFEAPGPGAYQPDYHKVIKINSSYKIGTSQKHIDFFKTTMNMPGPGQYETSKTTLLGLDHAVKFGRQKKMDFASDKKTPGPGEYQQTAYYNGSRANQPAVVFSKSSRSSSAGNLGLGPGPGAYLVKSELDESINKSRGFKMGAKIQTKEHKEAVIPGPGAYNYSTLNTKKSTPSFSLGKQPKFKIENFKEFMSKPGPLNYDIKISAFEHKSFAIGKEKRKGLAYQTEIPGPGAYDSKINLSSARTFSMPKSQRKSIGETQQTPSPFQYNPKAVFNTQYESIAIGRDNRRIFQVKDKIPGPGDYNYYLQDNKHNGFIKDRRDHEKKKEFPGPGQYDIPSTICNVPSYVSTVKK